MLFNFMFLLSNWKFKKPSTVLCRLLILLLFCQSCKRFRCANFVLVTKLEIKQLNYETRLWDVGGSQRAWRKNPQMKGRTFKLHKERSPLGFVPSRCEVRVLTSPSEFKHMKQVEDDQKEHSKIQNVLNQNTLFCLIFNFRNYHRKTTN